MENKAMKLTPKVPGIVENSNIMSDNYANCSAGYFPQGIDINRNIEDVGRFPVGDRLLISKH